jgi:hypothetical protein
MICEICSEPLDLDGAEMAGAQGYVVCKQCGFPNQVHTDRPFGRDSKLKTNGLRPVLKEGDVGRFDNPDHIWHNEPVVIRKTKPMFFRIEINGQLTWVPQDWIKTT